MNIVTIAGANQAGLPNLADFGLATDGGVKTGLFLRDFEIGILKPYQKNLDTGRGFVRFTPALAGQDRQDLTQQLLVAQEDQDNQANENPACAKSLQYPTSAFLILHINCRD